MKNKYLSLFFAGILLISGCETIGGSSSGSASGEFGDSKQANLQAYLQNEIGDRVYFETDKHNISSSSAFTLESQANWLKSTPGFQLLIEGHCDERGTREYNLALGERRGNAVKEFLASLGVDPGRLTVISYGKNDLQQKVVPLKLGLKIGELF